MIHAESYFEHQCTVATELDVLETDIPGHGRWVKVKRWFYSCFLLSYYDDRCHVFFMSSHAMRLERTRHFRLYRGRIHPLSFFSNMWKIIYLMILIFNRLLFHINTALFYGSQPHTIILGMICEFLALVDLIIKYKTGYTDEANRKIVLDATKGYIHFTTTRLFLYVAAAIPLHTMIFLRYGLRRCVLCKANKFICTLKLISLSTVLRLYVATSFLERRRTSYVINRICVYLRITIISILTMIQLTDLIDSINILIMLHKNFVYRHSYLDMIIRAKVNLQDVSNLFFVAVEISNLCKSAMLFGYGIYRNDYYLDKIFSLICHVIGVGFFTWGAVECYTVVQSQNYGEDNDWVRKQRAEMWMQSFQLSDVIYDKVLQYHKSKLSSPAIVERNNDLYRFLPTILTSEIKLSTYYSYVRRIPYFTEWPYDVVEELVLLLKEDIYLEGDYIVHLFTPGDGLVIVFAGILAVYDPTLKETGHLIDGDYFGELSLATDKVVGNYAINAVTECQVLTLNKGDFRRTMRKYENLFYEFRDLIRQKHEGNLTADVPDQNLDKR